MKRSGPPKRYTPLRGRTGGRRQTLAEALWRDAKEATLERDQWDCQADARGLGGYCAGRLEVHHILPRGRGGQHDPDNLVTLCHWHHGEVHAHPARSYELGLLARSAA